MSAPDLAVSASSASRPRLASITVCCAIFLAVFTSHAPSPLYGVYQGLWGFSSTTLTAIHATYGIAVLAALVLMGPVCDRITRRQAIVPGLALVAAGALLLACASSLPWLFAARVLGGLGTGVLSGAAAAALVELDPGAHRRAATLATLMLTAGATMGPAATSFALRFQLWPTVMPFLAVAAASLACAVILVRGPWPAQAGLTRAEFRWRQWRPRQLAVPAPIRAPFTLAALAICLAWASSAVFASLGPTLAMRVLGVAEPGVAGLVSVALHVVGAGAQAAFGTQPARRALCLGPLLVSAGLGLAVISFALGSSAVFAAAIAVLAVGYGAGFVGSVATVNLVTPPERRGEVLSALYAAAYLASALPVVATGAAMDALGMRSGMLLLAVVVAALSAVTVVAALRLFPGGATRTGTRTALE